MRLLQVRFTRNFLSLTIISFVQSIGEFVLTDCDMKIKPRGKIFSINEGYYKYFDQETKDYIDSLKNPKVRCNNI